MKFERLSEDVDISYSANSEEAFKIINNKVSYCLFIVLKLNHLDFNLQFKNH